MYRNAHSLASAAFCALLTATVTVAERPDSAPPLDSIRLANEGLYSSLKSFVCEERMERFVGHTGSAANRHLDTIEAKVSFENGQEHYSEIQRDKQSVRDLSTVPGAWSEGEFGTLLRQTEQLLHVEPVQFDGRGEIAGTPVSQFHFAVSKQDSPWDLEVAGRHYRVPFRADISVAEPAGEIVQIKRRSSGPVGDTRIAELEWSITLGAVDLNGKRWLLPKEGEYSVEYEGSGRREWNEVTFSDYHRYGAEVAVHFDSQN